MQVPLQIAFHKAEKSDWAEQEIRARVDKLQTYHDRIIGCRVTVDQRARNVEGTLPPVVRIEISLPGTAPVIVAYEPDRLQQKYQSPDLGNAINDAFNLAERRLAQIKEARDGRNKDGHHDSQRQFLGQVAQLYPNEDHGFLLTNEGSSLYFHRNSLLQGDFDQLKVGDEVRYVEEVGDTGPLATKVRVISNNKA
ncbi:MULTISPECIES: HPF/RaiA family ribosome-associated protein [Chelativorans]|jgi:cold shock CspA family protein/ribosome-associated translation inhibitor RaiA|uniref:Cold-shock DNA-binding protein family n=1 Tax=Chelativorans sp. (strain BNC1) TaxID=266779 RepID=Q11EM9_CHESB|nr:MULTISPECIES: HPF/RaiA family ribosome-associated protein [Chelativorans]